MSSSATYISQTYFLPLSTSPFNSTITRLCRNNFCGSGWATQPNNSTRSGSSQSLGGDLHAPTLENTLFKAYSEPEKRKSNPDKLFFFQSLPEGFCVCHPHVPLIVSEKASLSDGIQVQSTPPRITHVNWCCSFPLSWWCCEKDPLEDHHRAPLESRFPGLVWCIIPGDGGWWGGGDS